MKFKKFLNIVPIVMMLVAAGCDKDEKQTPPVPVNHVAPPASRAAEEKPHASASTDRAKILQSCLREHSESDRKYCECFAEQMDKDRGAPASAMACKKLRVENR